MTLETSFRTVGGRDVRYAAVGEGAPLVCLHGYPETLQLYARFARRLAGAFEVVAIDWPGLGASDPWPGPTNPSARADQLLAVLDALGHREAYLLGTDMGGPPALLAAAEAPERIRGVVVSNSLLVGDGETSLEIELFRTFPGINRLGLTYAPRVVFRRCLHTFLPDGTALDPELRADFWEHFGRREVRDRLVAMCVDYEAELGPLRARYRALECPVLACWGTDDHHFPPSQGQRLVDIVGGTLSLVEGGHHWMVWNRADAVARRVRNWVEG